MGLKLVGKEKMENKKTGAWPVVGSVFSRVDYIADSERFLGLSIHKMNMS